jgi:hypothetical protein
MTLKMVVPTFGSLELTLEGKDGIADFHCEISSYLAAEPSFFDVSILCFMGVMSLSADILCIFMGRTHITKTKPYPDEKVSCALVLIFPRTF